MYERKNRGGCFRRAVYLILWWLTSLNSPYFAVWWTDSDCNIHPRKHGSSEVLWHFFFLTNRIKITSGQQGLPVTVELVFCPRVLGEEDNGDRIQPVLL